MRVWPVVEGKKVFYTKQQDYDLVCERVDEVKKLTSQLDEVARRVQCGAPVAIDADRYETLRDFINGLTWQIGITAGQVGTLYANSESDPDECECEVRAFADDEFEVCGWLTDAELVNKKRGQKLKAPAAD